MDQQFVRLSVRFSDRERAEREWKEPESGEGKNRAKEEKKRGDRSTLVEREEKEREKERKKGEKGGRVIKSKWRKGECDEWKGFGIEPGKSIHIAINLYAPLPPSSERTLITRNRIAYKVANGRTAHR